MPVRVALVTDTHIRAPVDDGQLAFPSDRHHNARNRDVVAQVAAGRPDMVIHLGDVVHPIPTLPTHADALAQAKSMFEGFGAPLHVVPGNHDVGDKRSSVSAPEHVLTGRRAFADTWGPPFYSFDHDDVHFVIVDGGLLAADTAEAREQRAWLTDDLARAGRTFVFTHYPPFLTDPDEPEHYDNLDPQSRHWLIEACGRAGVEAMLTGHVHRFFYNRIGTMDLYTIPSTAFVRPAYAWLRPHPTPDAENGRDDPEHTGFAWLLIDETSHRLHVVRPRTTGPSAEPLSPRPLGTWLHHRLGRRAEVPTGSLDALTRKVARDDAALMHVLGTGLTRVRIPLSDGSDPDVCHRVAWLARHGVATDVFSAGPPTQAQRSLRAEVFPAADWEVVLRDADLRALRDVTDRPWAGETITLSRIGKPPADDGYFSHFPKQGFAIDDPQWRAFASDPAITRVALRIPASANITATVGDAVAQAAAVDLGATCHVELPQRTEADRHDNDHATAAVVAAADRAAKAHPSAHVLVDALYDYDRGYWCKNGLVDLADRPRAAVRALFEAS